jgi:DNA-binding TFAR19-related protein (PDSD5 family)
MNNNDDFYANIMIELEEIRRRKRIALQQMNMEDVAHYQLAEDMILRNIAPIPISPRQSLFGGLGQAVGGIQSGAAIRLQQQQAQAQQQYQQQAQLQDRQQAFEQAYRRQQLEGQAQTEMNRYHDVGLTPLQEVMARMNEITGVNDIHPSEPFTVFIIKILKDIQPGEWTGKRLESMNAYEFKVKGKILLLKEQDFKMHHSQETWYKILTEQLRLQEPIVNIPREEALLLEDVTGQRLVITEPQQDKRLDSIIVEEGE